LALFFTVSRSITTPMSCFSCFFSFGTSASAWTVPSTRAREYPCDWSCWNRSTYSPLRPRITGARTWNRTPSSMASTWSTICCGVCLEISSPHCGQWALPARA